MQSAMIYCSFCGAGNMSQAVYCFSCGQKILIGTLPPSTSTQSSSSSTGHLATRHLIKGRYVITKLLGRGGMGAVYQATDTQFGDRLVAVKEMSQGHLNSQEVLKATEQFKQEAHLLAGLKHPNLPSIYDHFTEDGRWYLIMDFIEGETIGERLDKAQGHTLPLSDVLGVGIQLAKVLGYLHTRPVPVIFRDLKPSNIMITSEGHVYLIDFGIARLFKQGQAKDTATYGSLGYMAPEQCNHEQTSSLSDIYSLGATLHQLLSDHNPRSNKPTIFHFEPLQAYNPTLPHMLTTLISQMVSIDKAQRPGSMLTVRGELESIQRQLQYAATQLVLPPQHNSSQKTQVATQYSKPQEAQMQPQYNKSQEAQVQLQYNKPQEVQIPPRAPKRRLFWVLPIGFVAAIICVYTTQSSIGIVISCIICMLSGFIVAKVAIVRKSALFTGILMGLVYGIGAPMVIHLGAYFAGYVLLFLVAIVIASLFNLLGAWFATRKHPYYVKKRGKRQAAE